MKNPLIIQISGPDSIGKNTQTNLLKEFFERNNVKVKTIEIPRKGLLTYPLIYVMLKCSLATKFPRFFHFLQFLNKFIFQLFCLSFYLIKYDVIIFDRWNFCSVAYGISTGIKKDHWLMKLNKLLVMPDYTFVLLGRAQKAENRDEYELNTELQESVKKIYSALLKENSHISKEVNANQDILQVHHDIVERVEELWKK